MEQLESIILYGLKKLNGERTIFSIYHLLNGKKSSQTIQDAHLFSLKTLFGICEGMSRESFEKIVRRLHERKWITHCGKQQFLLTPAGNSLLAEHRVLSYFNGWDFHQLSSLFWVRFSLFIQVISNLVFQETTYIPIQKNKDALNWIKIILRKIHLPKKQIGPAVYQELMDCFSRAEEINPSMLVFRLTGYQQIGLTAEQAAKKFNLDLYEYQIRFIQTIHYLLGEIKQDPNRYPLLHLLIADFRWNNELTLSASKTWELLSKGYSLEKIAQIRRLKRSTIEDHLVEIALNTPEFSIDSYVGKELQQQILEISRQSGLKQLKHIKENVKAASYFQIRLVLAKFGGGSWT